jgi:hypothetical protein
MLFQIFYSPSIWWFFLTGPAALFYARAAMLLQRPVHLMRGYHQLEIPWMLTASPLTKSYRRLINL